MRALGFVAIFVLMFGSASACGGDDSSGASGGAGGSATGGAAGTSTGGAGGTGGTSVADAGGEYFDDAGKCRTDDEAFTANCPATLDVPALCTMCSMQKQSTCGNIVKYANWCTPSRKCWYDLGTQKLVGAEYCDDISVHCGNKSMCVAGGETPDCVNPDPDPCAADAGADAPADAPADAGSG